MKDSGGQRRRKYLYNSYVGKGILLDAACATGMRVKHHLLKMHTFTQQLKVQPLSAASVHLISPKLKIVQRALRNTYQTELLILDIESY